MNCYIHTDRPAVAACADCGMGLCKKCVDNTIYRIENRPLCHDCSLKLAKSELSEARTRKVWSLVKFIFGASFLLLGYSIYSSTGDPVNAWIYAGIAGIPAAFKSTRASRREKIRNDIQDTLTNDVTDLAFSWIFRFLIRVALIVFLAPIMATFAALKNLFAFIGSFSAVNKAKQAYNYLISEEDIIIQVPLPTPMADTKVFPVDNSELSSISQQDEQMLRYAPSDMKSEVNAVSEIEEQSIISATVSQFPSSTNQQPTSVAVSKKNTGLFIVFGFLLVIVCIVCGYFWGYAPYAKDRDALRTYVVANNLFLRSSQVAGVEYNVINKVPYGTELITYEIMHDWAKVKVNGQEGYVSSPYVINSEDFFLLNGVWGDADSKECIESTKCRLAILDFYKTNRYSSGANGWQIYTRMQGQKPNTVFYPRLYGKSSKFTDFVFILKNNQGGNRIMVGYSFEDETEKPIFRFSVGIPEDGYIENIRLVRGEALVTLDTGYSFKFSL